MVRSNGVRHLFGRHLPSPNDTIPLEGGRGCRCLGANHQRANKPPDEKDGAVVGWWNRKRNGRLFSKKKPVIDCDSIVQPNECLLYFIQTSQRVRWLYWETQGVYALVRMVKSLTTLTHYGRDEAITKISLRIKFYHNHNHILLNYLTNDQRVNAKKWHAPLFIQKRWSFIVFHKRIWGAQGNGRLEGGIKPL